MLKIDEEYAVMFYVLFGLFLLVWFTIGIVVWIMKNGSGKEGE